MRYFEESKNKPSGEPSKDSSVTEDNSSHSKKKDDLYFDAADAVPKFKLDPVFYNNLTRDGYYGLSVDTKNILREHAFKLCSDQYNNFSGINPQLKIDDLVDVRNVPDNFYIHTNNTANYKKTLDGASNDNHEFIDKIVEEIVNNKDFMRKLHLNSALIKKTDYRPIGIKCRIHQAIVKGKNNCAQENLALR